MANIAAYIEGYMDKEGRIYIKGQPEENRWPRYQSHVIESLRGKVAEGIVETGVVLKIISTVRRQDPPVRVLPWGSGSEGDGNDCVG